MENTSTMFLRLRTIFCDGRSPVFRRSIRSRIGCCSPVPSCSPDSFVTARPRVYPLRSRTNDWPRHLCPGEGLSEVVHYDLLEEHAAREAHWCARLSSEEGGVFTRLARPDEAARSAPVRPSSRVRW